MSERSRKIIKVVLRLAITTVLLYWVVRQIDIGQFRHAAHTLRWPFLLATWACTLSFSAIQSVALRVSLRRQDCHVRLNTLFGATSITALYSMMLPGILSTGVKWYILTRDTGKGSRVFSAMVYNQMALFVTMSVVGFTALLVADPLAPVLGHEGRNHMIRIMAAVLLAVLVPSAILLVHPRTGGLAIRAFGWLLKPLPQKFRLKGQNVLRQIATFQTAGARFHLKIAAINVFDALVVLVLAYICAARAANITVPLGVFICLCATVYALSRLPVTVANLGLREVTLVGLLTGYGVEASSAMLMSMVLFSSHILLALIGAVYQLSWGMSSRKAIQSAEESSRRELERRRTDSAQ